MIARNSFLMMLLVAAPTLAQPPAWERFRGQPGPSGWRCHVIQADPEDDGPDGINLHDWDGDGDLDVFCNAEQGKYSRLYFNPGPVASREPWGEYIEFQHGPCEDSGIGDLDHDGDVDYIANGGWIFFNPGKDSLRDPNQWTRMILFKEEKRVPTVTDVDGDGLNDLIVGAERWYKQPIDGKHDAANWQSFPIGKNRWPMNCILLDVDKDGDDDIVVPDRGRELCWYVNPGRSQLSQPWKRKTIHSHPQAMFTAVADFNRDGLEDLAFAGGNNGDLARKLIVLIRTNRAGDPQFRQLTLAQPSGNFPKGCAVADLSAASERDVVIVIPKQGDIWVASYQGDPREAENWTTNTLEIPGAMTRTKMDNAYLGDVDNDGDVDILTTEENGGWGVIWFENPAR